MPGWRRVDHPIDLLSPEKRCSVVQAGAVAPQRGTYASLVQLQHPCVVATSQLVKGEVPRKMAMHRSPAVVVLHPGAEEIHSPRVVSRFIENVGHRVHRHAAARLADKRPLRQTARLLELVQLLQTKGTEREKVPVS